MSQVAFAEALGTKQSVVSKWEKGAHKPSPDAFAKLAGIAPDMEKFYFLEQAGIPSSYFMGDIGDKMPEAMIAAASDVVSKAFGAPGDRNIDAQMVPLLADPIAAGSPLSINESDIKTFVPMLPAWFPKGATVYAIEVDGDSMEPTLGHGYIAFIDVTKRDPAKLIGHMVAARVGDGCTIKWLRFSNKHYTLVPQHSSPRHEVRVMNDEDDWAVIGEVIRWVGAPPPPPKRK